MIAVVQRVKEAKVEVDEKIVGEIGQGFLVLLGVAQGDTDDDFEYIKRKVSKMRIFSDEKGKMNRSLEAIDGEILLISQFTLLANTKKGNRPSFIESADPAIANEYYEQMAKAWRDEGYTVETGEFGADMQVHLINDGPVTIIIDSKNP
ncbi:MAG: D-aminoacyl-tRNA deacylase [Tissierellia bacterium]|nr:D-aminoacyl-tRNA deacylase [Tissierellia bacterium]